MLDLETYTPN